MATDPTGWFDVTASIYGTAPYGTTNINHALASVAANLGGVLYFPPGTYTLTGSINTLPDDTTVMGCGVQTTLLNMSANNLPVFTTPTDTNSNIEIFGMTIAYTGTAASGATAIVVNGSTNVRIYDVTINGAYDGILLTGTTGASGKHCENVWITRVTTAFTATGNHAIEISGATVQASSGNHVGIHITDCSLAGTSSPTAAINLQNCQGVFINNCFETGFEHGLYINPIRAQDVVFNIFVSNSIFDVNATDSGRLENSSSGQSIYDLKFNNCTFSNAVVGFFTAVVTGTLFESISFSNCSVYSNTNYGIKLVNPNNIQITGCNVYDNNTSLSSYNGVYLSNVTDITICSNMINNNSSASPTAGIFIDTGCSNVLVDGCDVTGNGSATVPTVHYNLTSGQTGTISNNMGYNPTGYVKTIAGGTHTNTYPQMATIYLSGAMGAQIELGSTFEPATPIPNPTVLRVGPGQTFKVTPGSAVTYWFLD